MTTSFLSECRPTIYEFPARGRFALASQGDEKTPTNYLLPRVARKPPVAALVSRRGDSRTREPHKRTRH